MSYLDPHDHKTLQQRLECLDSEGSEYYEEEDEIDTAQVMALLIPLLSKAAGKAAMFAILRSIYSYISA
jgi:hypothetical protein